MEQTLEIANRYVKLCRENKNLEALDALFADDAVSVEAVSMPGLPQQINGKAAIREKGSWWLENHDVHASSITGPWPHGDRFIVGFQMDVTNKPSGQRMQLEEAGLFTVTNGKIAREEFFYAGA